MAGEQLKYILDANVFIEAYRHYYAFDVCPGFWASITHYGEQGILGSIDRVRDELKKEDDLGQWRSDISAAFFHPTDTDDVIEAYADVIKWAQGLTRLTPAAKGEFADDADAWLVAYAKTKGLLMVTHEESAPLSQKKLKIPDVCDGFGIKYKNSFQMLRELGVTYHWGGP